MKHSLINQSAKQKNVEVKQKKNVEVSKLDPLNWSITLVGRGNA